MPPEGDPVKVMGEPLQPTTLVVVGMFGVAKTVRAKVDGVPEQVPLEP